MAEELGGQGGDEGWGRKILKAVIGTTDEAAGPEVPEAAAQAAAPAGSVASGGDSIVGQIPQLATLIGLIRDLPPEVNKKTGAAIVRKTMGAMGVSVEDILMRTDIARSSIQTEIEANRKAIEDTKRQIAQMESNIESAQKKMSELDEVLELFK
ncbi:MAG: hypothetical protein AB1714_30335 [Acidobacteriota bacterium]